MSSNPLINLPYGKEYHLFLSFCQEDEEIAFNLLTQLEETYQLKCMYHIRDFTPGVTVTDNILNAIEKSMKIVYLVSQKFKENFMCQNEVMYGIIASHKHCENTMIPVLLENIDMPRELQTINYVNATILGTNVPKKIFEACLYGATSDCILPNIIPFQELYNGTPLRVLRRFETWKRCIPVSHFREDVGMRRNISDKDRSDKIDTLCNAILEDLNSSLFIRRYFLYSLRFICRMWCFLLLGLPSLAVLPVLLFLIFEGDITEVALAGLCSTLVIVPIIAVSIASGVYFYRIFTKSGRKLEIITWKYLKKHYKTLKVLPLLRTTEEVVLLNYDTEECKKFCIYALKRNMIDEDEIEVMAEKIILDCIERNQTALAQWIGLPDYKYNRHNTRGQKKCICQCIEPSLVEISDS